MASPDTIKFDIHTPNPTGFSLFNVIQDPRSFAPDDIKQACNNFAILENPPEPARLAKSTLFFLRYLFDDFFKKAHQTGLYNRQRELFEAIGRVESGEVSPVTYGMFFNKAQWPCNDIIFSDKEGNPLIVARVVEEDDSIERKDKSTVMDWLRDFIDKLNKLQTRKGCVGGAFFCFTGSFPAEVKSKVERMVGSSDPLAKFDCRLPSPAMMPLNLLEFEKWVRPDDTPDDTNMPFYWYTPKLILPELK